MLMREHVPSEVGVDRSDGLRLGLHVVDCSSGFCCCVQSRSSAVVMSVRADEPVTACSESCWKALL